MPVQQIAVSPAFRLQTRANNGKKDSKPKPSPLKKKDGAKETLHPDSPTPKTTERCESRLSLMSAGMEICRICHCESETDAPLMSPCLCSGSMKYVHQACLQKWIKSSENKACELCKYDFVMSTKVKPFKEWEKLHMNPVERRKIVCSVTFHVIAITCVIWSLYVLIDRTTQEVRDGMLEWPFWTKLIVVVIGFSGGIVFMYVQCKMYLQLCRRWRAYNEVIMIENVAPLCKVATVMTLKIDKHEPDLHVDESDVGLGAGVAVEVGVDAGSQANCPTPTSVNTPTPDTSAPSTPTSTLSPREPNSVIITTTSQLETPGSLWTETNSSSTPSTDNETPNTKVVISPSSVEQGPPRTQYPI